MYTIGVIARILSLRALDHMCVTAEMAIKLEAPFTLERLEQGKRYASRFTWEEYGKNLKSVYMDLLPKTA